MSQKDENGPGDSLEDAGKVVPSNIPEAVENILRSEETTSKKGNIVPGRITGMKFVLETHSSPNAKVHVIVKRKARYAQRAVVASENDVLFDAHALSWSNVTPPHETILVRPRDTFLYVACLNWYGRGPGGKKDIRPVTEATWTASLHKGWFHAHTRQLTTKTVYIKSEDVGGTSGSYDDCEVTFTWDVPVDSDTPGKVERP